MFEDRDEDDAAERSSDAQTRAKEKADEFRMMAELFAVFEGTRKWDAELRIGLDAQVARDIQRTMARLDKAKDANSPIIPPASMKEAADLLQYPASHSLSTNDYHIHRRVGELMIIRWLAGDEVDAYYERLQAHFDAALEGFKEDERQALEWRQDDKTEKYLEALDKIEVKMAERYLREPIKTHKVFVLSTQSADEMNITFLCDYVMSISVSDLVGTTSAPGDEPTDRDLAWFFKLFALRGIIEGQERMCFFAFLQKSDEGDW